MSMPDATTLTMPDCSYCRAGTTNLAELDRRRHQALLDAFGADLLALVDAGEAQATALAVAAAGGGR